MPEAYIIDGIRTPIGRFGGGLSQVRADDLAAVTLREVLSRSPSVDPAAVDDVILGCANQAGEDNRNVARMALLLAGMPSSVPGETVNRLCASGLSAAVSGARALQTGDGELYLVGGVESMTRAPYVLSKSAVPFARDARLFDTSLGWRFINSRMEELYGVDSMGQTAENIAEDCSISREDQDEYAFRSQRKATAARANGRLAREIVDVLVPQRKGEPMSVTSDEFIRPETTREALGKLRPAFRKDGRGSVTAGNSSGINDGSCALLLASEKAARRWGLSPKARILSSAVVGVEPRVMGLGPVEAIRRALDRADLSLDKIDVIELNEAFAAQTVACLRGLNLEDNDERVNPNGGAIALGHPLGMSGARLLLTATLQLVKTRKRYGLCTMCVGVGQGMAAIIERVD